MITPTIGMSPHNSIVPRKPRLPPPGFSILGPAGIFMSARPFAPHILLSIVALADPRRRIRNGPPQPAPESHLFRAGPAAPCPQHRHRIHVRGRPPLPLHDARRLWRARSRRGDPTRSRRMATAYARL